jgi:hypothetical protein
VSLQEISQEELEAADGRLVSRCKIQETHPTTTRWNIVWGVSSRYEHVVPFRVCLSLALSPKYITCSPSNPLLQRLSSHPAVTSPVHPLSHGTLATDTSPWLRARSDGRMSFPRFRSSSIHPHASSSVIPRNLRTLAVHVYLTC